MEAQQTVLQALKEIFSGTQNIKIPSDEDLSQIKELLDRAERLSQSLQGEDLNAFQGFLDFIMTKAVMQIDAAKIPQLLRLANGIATKYSLNINSKSLDRRIAEFLSQEIEYFSYPNSAKDLFVAMSQIGFGAQHLQTGAKAMSEIFSKSLSRRIFSEDEIGDLVTMGTHFKNLGLLDKEKARDFLIKVNNYYKPKKREESAKSQELAIPNISDISSSSLFEIVAYYYSALEGERLDLELEKRFFSGEQKDQSEASEEELQPQREFFEKIVRACKKLRLGTPTEGPDEKDRLKKVIVGDFEFEFEGEYAKIGNFRKFGDVVVRDLKAKKIIAVCELDGKKDHFVSIDGESVERGKYLARDEVIKGGGSFLISMTGTESKSAETFAEKISPLVEKMSDIIAERARLKKAAEDAKRERELQQMIAQREAVDKAYQDAMLKISEMAQVEAAKVGETKNMTLTLDQRREDLLQQLQAFQSVVAQKFAALASRLGATNVAAAEVEEEIEVVPVEAFKDKPLDKLDSEMSVPEESLQEAFVRIVFAAKEKSDLRHSAIEECLKSAEKEKAIDELNSVAKDGVGAMQFAIEAKDEILVNLLNIYGVTKLPDGYRVDEDHKLYDLLVRLFRWEVVDKKKFEIPDDIKGFNINLEDPLLSGDVLDRAQSIKDSERASGNSRLNDCGLALLNECLSAKDKKSADFLVRNRDLLFDGEAVQKDGQQLVYAAIILGKAIEEDSAAIVKSVLKIYPELPNFKPETQKMSLVAQCIDGDGREALKAFAQNNFIFSDEDFVDIVRRYTVGVAPDFELVNLVVRQDLSKLKRCIDEDKGNVVINAIRQVFNDAVKKRDNKFVREILESDCGVDLLRHKDKGNTSIFTAIASGNSEALEACLQKAEYEDCVTENDAGMTPLYLAVLLGKDKMVSDLITSLSRCFALMAGVKNEIIAQKYLLTNFIDKKYKKDKSPRELAEDRLKAAKEKFKTSKEAQGDVYKYERIESSMNICTRIANSHKEIDEEATSSVAPAHMVHPQAVPISRIDQVILRALNAPVFEAQKIVDALAKQKNENAIYTKYRSLGNLDVLQFLAQEATKKYPYYRVMQCFRALAQGGVRFDHKYEKGDDRPFDYFMRNGDLDAAEFLLKNGASISQDVVVSAIYEQCFDFSGNNEYSSETMDFLCEKRPLEVAQIFIDMRSNIETDKSLESIKSFCPISPYTEALKLAMASGKFGVVQELLENRTSFTYDSFEKQSLKENGTSDESKYFLNKIAELEEESRGNLGERSNQNMVAAIDMILENHGFEVCKLVDAHWGLIFLDRAAKKYPEEFKNYLKAELVSTSPPSAEETLSYVVLMDDVAMFQEFGLQENIRRCYFDTGDGEYSILESAIEHQSPKIFQHFLPLLTDADASEGEDGKKGVLKTLLLSASHKQSLEIVKTIFAAGEPWNGEDVVNAFAISVQNCATNIAEFLLKKVDDVSSLCVLCHEATMVDDLELATKIANKMRAIASSESSEKGDDVWLRVVRASGSLLIIDAIESNSLEFLQSIICDVDLASCDFEVKDDKKQTILTFAMSSTYEMVEALLVHQKNFLIKKYGKDQGEMEYKKFLDKKDEYDNASPLDVARRYTDNEETVYLLLREGANDKERANNRGQSPSAQAVPQGAAAAAAAKANIWQAP